MHKDKPATAPKVVKEDRKSEEALVTVFTVANPSEAEIIKNALQADGIRCFLEGIHQAGAAGVMGLEIKVQVPARDAGRARKMMRYHEAHAKT